MPNEVNPLNTQAEAQALAHNDFNEAAALYQNSFRTAYLSRRNLRIRLKSAAFKWIRISASVSLPSVAVLPPGSHRIESLRMNLISKNPPTSMKWLLKRVGQSGKRYLLSEPQSYVSEWTSYRIKEIDDALAKPGSWRHHGPRCRLVRIETNEALGTFRIAAIATASEDEELLKFVGLLLEP